MKHLIPQEQRGRTLSNIITLAAGMAMLAVLLYYRQLWGALASFVHLLSPFLVGCALAFLQLPIVRKAEWVLERTLFRQKKRPRIMRALSAVFSMAVLVTLVFAFLSILLPQLFESIKSLVVTLSGFINENAESINEYLSRYEMLDFITFDGEQLEIAWEGALANLSSYTSVLVNNVMLISNRVYNIVFQAIVGLITAFYLVMDSERFARQAKKFCYATWSEATCERLIYWTRRANHIFAGFISGKIVDSLIIGVICYFAMLPLGLEYPLLISVIVGLTNVVPFFGPFIGAVPSILILLIINPSHALIFTILILILQQVDGNVIGPVILGDSVGISALLIMISIILGSGLFGFVGMLMAVPVVALIYAIVKTVLENRLRARGLPLRSESYADAPESLPDPAAEGEEAPKKPSLLKRALRLIHK